MRNFNEDLKKKKGSLVLLICLSLVLVYKFLVYFFLQKDPPKRWRFALKICVLLCIILLSASV